MKGQRGSIRCAPEDALQLVEPVEHDAHLLTPRSLALGMEKNESLAVRSGDFEVGKCLSDQVGPMIAEQYEEAPHASCDFPRRFHFMREGPRFHGAGGCQGRALSLANLEPFYDGLRHLGEEGPASEKSFPLGRPPLANFQGQGL